ncbi:Mrp/NBP35 family ATP-binding protein [Chrysiogenes arsenatis]|uniref:Mrp/NBP35 family ATP-binding protein n=1 Tax=Chrysiogenes arsenatis TaxID=309797 RepID=UPI0003F4CB3E|nr:Mrp/NBP35 family ATP-binding protein [Chrysiogenes arsenatis]
MSLTVEKVREALAPVKDPEIGKTLLELGMIKDIQVDGGDVLVVVELTTAGCPLKTQIERECREAVETVAGVKSVAIRLTAPETTAVENPLPGIKHIVAIGSGKGGVGKSTVTCNMAVALARMGYKVGLMDADIYGPSVPKMFGVTERPTVRGEDIVPPQTADGIKIMSMGFFLDENDPVIWRGPVIHSAIKQFMCEVAWEELDFLLLDLPPGTGDVQLSLVQTVPITGAVVVSTPQDVALLDARKAVAMFEKTGVEILGIVENMSYHICPNCNHESHIFGTEGARKYAAEKKLPFLGDLPLSIAVRETGDAGTPFYAALESESDLAKKFTKIAKNLVASVSVRMQTKPAPQKIGVSKGGKSACSGG